MHHSPMHYQLNDAERKLLSAYSYNMLDAKSPLDLDVAKEKALQEESYRNSWKGESPDWLESLHIDLVKHINKQIKENPEVFRSMISSFMINVDTAYAGFAGMFGDETMPRLSGLVIDEIDIEAPHLRWLKIIDEKLVSMVENGADEYDAFRYLNQAFELDLTFEKYKELVEEYSNYGMTVRQYLEWYLRSDANMNGEQPTIEFAQRVGKTLGVWCSDGELSKNNIGWMNRNFEIHPQHRNDMKAWAQKSVSVIHDMNNDLSLSK